MSREIRDVTCIVCPTGCRIRVTKEGTTVLDVTGNTCRRGAAYASQEAVAPQRTLTTSVSVRRGELPLVSVKSSVPVPKERLAELMGVVRCAVVDAPVVVGDIVVHHPLGLDADLVATRCVRRAV